MKLKGQTKIIIGAVLSVVCPCFFYNVSVSAADNIMEIDADAPFSSTINVAPGDTLVINGNGHVLTRGDGFSGSLFSVSDGASLTINDLIIDGGAPNIIRDFDDLQTIYNSVQTASYALYGVTVDDSTNVVNASIINNKGSLVFNNSQINNCITNSVSPGITNSGMLKIVDSSFSDNAILTSHGGVIRSTAGSVAISASTFSGNNAGTVDSARHGGAIYAAGGSLDISESVFDGNSAEAAGGALYTPGADISITSSIFKNNKVGQNGSAVYFGGTDGERMAVFKNNKIINNVALGYYINSDISNDTGAIIYRGKGFASISINGDTYDGNIASYYPALSLNGSSVNIPSVSIKNITLTNNKSQRAGATAEIRRADEVFADGIEFNHNEGNLGFWQNNAVTATNINITENDWNGSTAMLWVHGGETASLSNITIANNTTGAFYSKDQGSLSIDSLTVSNNSAPKNGAVILTNVNDVTISNSTITDNFARGGGIRFLTTSSDFEGTATLKSVTITRNHSDRSGGGIRLEDRARRTVIIEDDTAIFGNSADGGGDDIYMTALEDGETSKDILLPSNLFYYLDPQDARYVDSDKHEPTDGIYKSSDAYYIKVFKTRQDIEPEPEPEPTPTPEPTPAPIIPVVPDNPPTSDNIVVLAALFAASCLGLCATLVRKNP